MLQIFGFFLIMSSKLKSDDFYQHFWFSRVHELRHTPGSKTKFFGPKNAIYFRAFVFIRNSKDQGCDAFISYYVNRQEYTFLIKLFLISCYKKCVGTKSLQIKKTCAIKLYVENYILLLYPTNFLKQKIGN